MNRGRPEHLAGQIPVMFILPTYSGVSSSLSIMFLIMDSKNGQAQCCQSWRNTQEVHPADIFSCVSRPSYNLSKCWTQDNQARYCQTFPSFPSSVSEDQKGDQSHSNECSSSFMVQESHTTTRVMKVVPLEMPPTATKALANR